MVIDTNRNRRQISFCLAMVAAVVVATAAAIRGASIHVAGDAPIQLIPGVGKDNKWDGTYAVAGVGGSIYVVEPLVIVPIDSHPGENLHWSSIGDWDNTLLSVVDGVRVSAVLVREVEGAPIPDLIARAKDGVRVLESLGPTEIATPRELIDVSVPSVPTIQLTLLAQVGLTYDVNIVSGSSMAMDQRAVAVHSLNVSPGGELFGGNDFVCRTSLVNSGHIAGISGVVEGNFSNVAIAQLGSLTINGTFHNNGDLDVGGVLTLSAPSTNDAHMTLSGGPIVSPGGFTNYGTFDHKGGYVNTGSGTTLNLKTYNWSGGSIYSLTNQSDLNINTSAPGANLSGVLTNVGKIVHGSGPISFANGTLINTNGATYDIRGDSVTLNGSGVIQNAGTFLKSAGAESTVAIPLVNTGTVSTKTGLLNLNAAIINTGGGKLVAEGGTLNIGFYTAVSNSGGAIAAGSGAIVQLSGGSSVTGGTLTTSGGTIRCTGTTVSDLTNSGTLVFAGNNGLTLQGQINNTGLISSDTSTGDYDLNVSEAATLSGGGEVRLNTGSSSRINFVPGVNGQAGTLTNQDNLIHGWGRIYGSLVNRGTVSADIGGQTLDVLAASGPVANAGTFKAENGGTLTIGFFTPVSNSGGIISAAGGGSVVQLTGGSSVTAGTLTTSGSGTIRSTGSTVSDVTNAGILVFADNHGLTLQGQINNIGVISSDTGTGDYDLNVSQGEAATLTGGGQVLLNTGSSRINFVAGVNGQAGTLTNQDNLIHGRGRIYGGLVNKGTVSADVNGQTLDVLAITGPVINAGTFKAENGGTLHVSSLTNLAGTTLAGGTYEADAGGILELPGQVETNAATVTIRGTTSKFPALSSLKLNSGILNILDGAEFSTGSLTNSGIINLDPSNLNVSGSYVQTSAGVMTLTLAGTESGQYDVLTVAGAAQFGGTLSILFADGYLPNLGDSFPVVNYAVLGGEFAQISSPSGFQFTPGYGTAGLTLVVAATPEPNPLTLVGVAAMAYLGTRGRKRCRSLLS
jgi:hypothetical protein